MSSFNFCGCEKSRRPAPMCHRDNGYIVERIIDRNRENYCYRGLLSVCDIRSDICPPLCLKRIDVLGAEPIATSCSGQKLRLILALQGVDSRNSCFQGTAYLELDTMLSSNGFERCRINIRRDIQVCIQSAEYCQPCGFQVCLSISIESILSRYEIIYQQSDCCAPKPNLPLYPPPMCSRNDNFGCYFK